MAESRRIECDWSAPARTRRTSPAAAATVVAVTIAVVLLWVVAGPVPAILIAGAAGAWVASSWWSQGPRLLRRVGARPTREPRLVNLVTGLARDLGRGSPAVFEADGAPNAFAVPHARSGAIVVTRSLVDRVTRTELEAVVAGCLVRLDDSVLRRARWSSVFGFLAGGGTPVSGAELDVRSAALTRYPPALAAAIEKAEPVRGPLAPFALVAEAPWAPAPAVRAAQLRDL